MVQADQDRLENLRAALHAIAENGAAAYISELNVADSRQYFKLCVNYDYIEPHYGFSKDLILVRKDNEYSFAYKDGSLFKKDTWFSNTQSPSEGWVCVMTKRCKDHRSDIIDSYDWNNYVDQFGNLLLSDGFCHCHSFHNGFALVYEENNGKRGMINYITLKGEKLLKKSNFSEGEFFTDTKRTLVRDKTTREWSMIDNYGNIVVSFDKIEWADGFKHAIVGTKSKKCNIIDIDGNICCNEWFDNIDEFWHHYIVKKGNYFNILDQKFNFMFPSWFDKYWLIPDFDGVLCSFNGILKIVRFDELNCFVAVIRLSHQRSNAAGDFLSSGTASA